MHTMLHVRPAEGCTILHPETSRPIPAKGQRVPAHPDIRRAIARGDLESVEDPPVRTSTKASHEKEG
jgi:hypothetical protein